MTIEELRERKKNDEKNIVKILREFMKDTNLNIKEVVIQIIDYEGISNNKNEILWADIRVQL